MFVTLLLLIIFLLPLSQHADELVILLGIAEEVSRTIRDAVPEFFLERACFYALP